MADRIRIRLTAILEGIPLMNEISEFTAPEISFKMAESEGSFVSCEDAVALEKLSFTLKLRGDHGLLSPVVGKFLMRPGQFNVTERGKSTDGIPYIEEHSLYAIIKSVKKEAYKMGEKPTVTIEGTCKAYTLKDTGTLIHDINIDTGKTVVFGEDIMSQAGVI